MNNLTFDVTIDNESLSISEERGQTLEFSFEVQFLNDSLEIGEDGEMDNPSLLVTFAKVFKGDKGDKGDSPVLTADADGVIYSDGEMLTDAIKRSIAAGGSLKTSPQALTEEQKKTTRQNIDVYSKNETDVSVETKIDVTLGNINALLATI